MFRKMASAGIPSFSYMAMKNIGSMAPIISSAAALFPIAPRVKIYVGIPVAAATLKHISWRLVKFKATLLFTLLRSFGTETKGMSNWKNYQLIAPVLASLVIFPSSFLVRKW